SGIGEQTVKLFSALGARVVVTGRNASQVETVVQEVQRLSPQKLKPLGVVADLTKDADIERLFNETIKTFNRLDVLVNNAGVLIQGNGTEKDFLDILPLGVVADLTKDTDIERLFNETIKTFNRLDVLVNNAGVLIQGNGTEKDFLDILDQSERVDVKASLQLIRLSVPYLQKTNGSIINIGSIISERPKKSQLAYNLAKTSLTTISNVLAIELGPQGIRVNTLSVGVVLKPGIPDKVIKKCAKYTPLGRIGQ
ncbi:unnamed protein product, partial [Oppiella nova]